MLERTSRAFRGLDGFFHRSRVVAYCTMLLAGQVVLGIGWIGSAYNVFGTPSSLVMTDFTSFYAAGRLADAGTPALVYDRAAHHAEENKAIGHDVAYNYFYYPPIFLMLCQILAKLPYTLSFLVFETATLALYVIIAVRTVGATTWTTAVPLVAFPAAFWNFGFGQNGFLNAFLWGAGLLLLERRPFIAGVVFGGFCYKPQLALLIPVALLAGRQWRAIAGAAISSIALLILSIVVLGPDTWQAFITSALGAHTAFESSIKKGVFVSPFGAVITVGGGSVFAYIVQAVASLFAVALVAVAWGRRLSLQLRAAVLLSSALIAFPVVMFYDLLLGALAAAWLWREKAAFEPGERAVLAVLFVACIDPVLVAQKLSLPIGPAAAAALVALVIHRLWRRVAGPQGRGDRDVPFRDIEEGSLVS